MMKKLHNYQCHLNLNQKINPGNNKNLFVFGNYMASYYRTAGILFLVMVSVIASANKTYGQNYDDTFGVASNTNNDYYDADNDKTLAGGPLRVGMLFEEAGNGPVWSGMAQMLIDASNNNYAGLFIDSDSETTRTWDIWMQGKEVLMDANYMRFKNTGSDGLVWGSASWNNINSRIMDDGNLKIQTDNNFHIQDIDTDGSSAITRFSINTTSGNVGIGDESPSAKFNSVGLVRASFEADETNYLEMWHGGSNAYFNFSGAGNLNFRNNSNTYMTMTPTGQFGIGTTNPGEFLEVQPDQDISAIIGRAHIGYNGADTNWASFAHTDMNSSSNYALMQSDSGTTKINAASSRDIEFAVGGTTRMSLAHSSIATDLLIEAGEPNGRDTNVTIRGSRTTSVSGNRASMIFENYDSDIPSTNKLGMISGVVTNSTNNIGDLVFYTYADGATASENLRLTSGGTADMSTANIATSNIETLYVKTQAVIKQLEIDPDKTTWPDYVFKSDYNLRSLSEVEGFVEKNGHLPEVPSADEVAEKGINVYEMQELMMKKIEELTLYMIDLKKENTALKSRIDQLSK